MENYNLTFRFKLYPSHQLHLVWHSGHSTGRRTTLCPSSSLFHFSATPLPYCVLFWILHIGLRRKDGAEASRCQQMLFALIA